jgi:hypothetical protein
METHYTPLIYSPQDDFCLIAAGDSRRPDFDAPSQLGAGCRLEMLRKSEL